jgi:hypothetical protein
MVKTCLNVHHIDSSEDTLISKKLIFYLEISYAYLLRCLDQSYFASDCL